MNTIVLNKKKKVILWKRIAAMVVICMTILGLGFLSMHLRIRYQYYRISPELKKSIIGYSNNKNLIDIVAIEKIKEIKDNDFEIESYNFDNILDRKWVITWDQPTNDNKITTTIKKYIYVIVYAYKFKLDNKEYIVPSDKVDYIIRELKEINPELTTSSFEGIFISHKKVLTDEEINNLISEYKK